MGPLLVTGSAGLIGTALGQALHDAGFPTRGFDLRGEGAERGDVRDAAAVGQAVAGCSGVIHLAAVSRVVEAEREPERCWSTNVGGLENVLAAAAATANKARPPWVVFGSSREVYGRPARLPADEDTPLNPINHYARSKVAGETRVGEARLAGLRAGVVRFSNVYGRTTDHADRVVPAFARAAATGGTITVHGAPGAEASFDFTHLDDVLDGLLRLVRRLEAGQDVPPALQFVSGRSTTLGELAQLAVTCSGGASRVVHAPASPLHVNRFVGSPERARTLLQWTSTTPLELGFTRLVDTHRAHRAHRG